MAPGFRGPGGASPLGPLARGAPWPLVLWPCAQRPWRPEKVGFGAHGRWCPWDLGRCLGRVIVRVIVAIQRIILFSFK